MKTPSFSEGERIKWFNYYADMIVKEAGYGTVICREAVDLNISNIPTQDLYEAITIYDVLIDGGSMETFEEYALEKCPDSSVG